jgi:hypothetical protein
LAQFAPNFRAISVLLFLILFFSSIPIQKFPQEGASQTVAQFPINPPHDPDSSVFYIVVIFDLVLPFFLQFSIQLIVSQDPIVSLVAPPISAS